LLEKRRSRNHSRIKVFNARQIRPVLEWVNNRIITIGILIIKSKNCTPRLLVLDDRMIIIDTAMLSVRARPAGLSKVPNSPISL